MAISILIPVTLEDWTRLGPLKNWEHMKFYCYVCQEWFYPLRDRTCPRGPEGSRIWINTITMQKYCDKCGDLSPVEADDCYCNQCNRWQPVVFSDASLVMSAGDTVVSFHGDTLCIRRRSGALVIVKRHFYNVGAAR